MSELHDEIGEEDFAEVVELFLEEVDGTIQELRDGVEEDRVEACLHFLKGSALNLGFREFSTLCASGEARAAGGEPGAVDLGEVVVCYDRSKERFLSELQSRLAA
ncbi:Hpt domain-containing protein [Phycobium rhodophyticola]